MNADKEVGLGTVGNLGTFMQFHEDICLACINHLCSRAVLFNQPSQFLGNSQIDILLLAEKPDGTRVLSSMPCIYNNSVCLSTDAQAYTQ